MSAGISQATPTPFAGFAFTTPAAQCFRRRVGAEVSDAAAQAAWVRMLIDLETSQSGEQLEGPGWLTRLCRAAGRTLSASGVGMTVITGAGLAGLTAASDADAAKVEELQFTLGEGPCVDAVRSGRPVLTADLGAAGGSKWPVYSAAAYELGVRAVFAFPLQAGSVRMGAIDIYRGRSGPLNALEVADALAFAEVAMTGLLDGQAQAGDDVVPLVLLQGVDTRLEVHQAQGMVMIQLECSLSQAMARLRAFAFTADRSVSDVARDIVARKIVLERDPS